MLQIGSVVDKKYKVLNEIGHGGMSVVYLAINEKANKTWAIKEVRKDGIHDEKMVKQGLIAETNILKKLDNKYLPSIVDVIEDKDTFLIVMDYIQGKGLDQILNRKLREENRPIDVENVISWGIQLCEVLSYLHTQEQPIIYRDLKPSNIMLKPDGQISLIDFGTARVYKEGGKDDTTTLGTPGYAAPEQYGGNGQSCQQSDIYGLGATLYHLITGVNPGETPCNIPLITEGRKTLLEETPWELRDKLLGLELIIKKCVSYKIEDRYKNCLEVKYALEHPEELGLPHRKKLKNKLLAFGACLGTGILLGCVSVFGMFMENRTEKTGYDYYIDSAATSTYDKKMSYYRQAVALNPEDERAWLGILDAVEEDNDFTTDEDSFIIATLSGRDYGRSKDNKTCFQENKAGYIQFSYRLGLMYYYNQGVGNNKTSALGWFETIKSQDLEELDLDPRELQAMKTRVEVLGKISGYSRKIGQVNQAGDAEVSYKDYWNDLMKLTDRDIAQQDNVITELRLYNEVVYQICTNYDKFKQDGLSKEEMEEALEKIEKTVTSIDMENNSSLAAEIQQTILENIHDSGRASPSP